jgi:hypothetical protein
MSLAEFQPTCDGVVLAVVQAVCRESVLTHDRRTPRGVTYQVRRIGIMNWPHRGLAPAP